MSKTNEYSSWLNKQMIRARNEVCNWVLFPFVNIMHIQHSGNNNAVSTKLEKCSQGYSPQV
jgi:hypothetical protein